MKTQKQKICNSIYKAVADSLCELAIQKKCEMAKAYKDGLITAIEFIEYIEKK